ncbi:MAG TPA: TetR/AcrR family transcriptional regulator [Streptosporangiaceae bacterium]|nr:TetR/AcrR family transcriptional regulator [Streptosporangiaceae bacterium]
MTTADSTTGRRRTPSSDVRRELLGAAEAVLVREGPAGVTVRAVAAEAGIAPMGVYNRFGGKDGLVDALLIKGFDGLRAAVASRGEPDMLERLRASGERYRQFALTSRHFYAIMFEGALPHDAISAEATEHARAAFGALVTIVESAALAGVIIAPDPHETAQQIWSTVHGAVTLELQGLVQTPDPAQTYRDTVETVLRGLRPAAPAS